MNDDPIPAMRAQIDQAIASLPDLAQWARGAAHDILRGSGARRR